MIFRELAARGPGFAFVALLVGCTVSKGESETGGQTGSETGATSSDESDGTGTTAGAPTTGGVSEERFGFTCVDLNPGEAVDGDPFLGTYRIRVRLNYEPCLQDYYLNNHPKMRLDGVEGPAVFEAWKQRLCTEPVEGRVDCEIDGFTQILMATGTEAYYLEVAYITPDPGQLNGGTLLWGPGPLPDYAECAEGLQPFVNLSQLSGVIGEDKDGNTLWQLQSFGDKRGVMKLGGGGCIQANVAPVGG